MGDFLYGWRRKAGGVALVLACVVVAGWVRSWRVDDLIQLTSEEDMATDIHIRSFEGFLIMQVETLVPPKPIKWAVPKWSIVELHKTAAADDPMIWRFRWCGFAAGYELGRAYLPDGRVDLWFIPYWSIVIPLTLLSAYLLLVKPRKPKLGPTQI